MWQLASVALQDAYTDFVLYRQAMRCTQNTLTFYGYGRAIGYHNPRDKAVILLMVDTGLRRAEVIALNWGDVDIATGLVRVTRGKGGKAPLGGYRRDNAPCASCVPPNTGRRDR